MVTSTEKTKQNKNEPQLCCYGVYFSMTSLMQKCLICNNQNQPKQPLTASSPQRSRSSRRGSSGGDDDDDDDAGRGPSIVAGSTLDFKIQ